MNLLKKIQELFSKKEASNVVQNSSQDVFQAQVKALLDKNTIKNSTQLQSSGSKMALELYDISFRLYKTNFGTVNLETLIKDEFGMFFKTIGYYVINQGKVTDIFLLKEFENAYNQLKIKSPKVRLLTKEENIYIALCSRETFNAVKKMFKRLDYNAMNHLTAQNFQQENLKSNGINILVKTSMMGSLEAVCVDENYDSDEDIFVMFQNNHGISLHCNEPVFHRLHKQELFGAFK